MASFATQQLNMTVGNIMSGSITAAISPLAMTFGFILWGEAWQSSAYALNQFKCTLAGVIFLFISLSIRSAIPVTASDQSMIILSSILGIVIGDNTWLLALQMIGAKRVIVIDTLKPFLAAVLGNWFLNEAFTMSMACGIIISSVGVLLVSLEKETDHESLPPGSDHDNRFTVDDSTSHDEQKRQVLNAAATSDHPTGSKKTLIIGYIFAAINVGLDAIGSVLTKQFGTELNTWEINFLRFGFAAISMSVIAAIFYIINHIILGKPIYSTLNIVEKGSYSVISPLGDSVHGSRTHTPAFQPLEIEKGSEVSSTVSMVTSSDHPSDKPKRAKEDHIWYIFPHYSDMMREEWTKVIVGIMFVTFLCPALSNYALFQIPLGLCLTLTSLGPVYSIPLAFFIAGDKTGLQGVVGAFLAVVGVGIMFSFK